MGLSRPLRGFWYHDFIFDLDLGLLAENVAWEALITVWVDGVVQSWILSQHRLARVVDRQFRVVQR